MAYLKRFAVKNGKRVPRSLNEQPFLSSLAAFTALSLTKSLHLCLYNKEIQKCLLMPGLTDSGINISKQCVDHCYISIKLLAFPSLFALQLNQTILLS